MTNTTKLALAAATAAPIALLLALPAQAQSAGTADLNRAVQQSQTWTSTNQRIQAAFPTQITALQTRQQALQNELRPLIAQLDTNHDGDVSEQEAAANPTLVRQIQTRQQAVATELAPTAQPIERAQAYLQEQIGDKLQQAVNNVMATRHLSMLVRPEGVLTLSTDQSANVTAAISAEIDRLITTPIAVPPPATWTPRAAGAAAGAPGAAAPATTTPPAAGTRRPTGR